MPVPPALAEQAPPRRAHEPHRRDLLRGLGRIADPKITLASVAGMMLGAAAAAHDGPLAWGWLALTVAGIFCVEAAKNASGEVFDWDSGADLAVLPEDRSPFSGGKRVLVDGLMSRRQTLTVAGVFYLLAAIAGSAIVVGREPRVLWLGLAGLGLAFFYHAPPLRLAYRGLGEIAVGLAYGPLLATGTYLVQRGEAPRSVVLLGLPLGLAIAAFLWINEMPDRRADASSGKRTLVVRLGPERAARGFAILLGLAFAGVALLPLADLPPAVLLGLVGLPHAVAAARRVLAAPSSTPALVPAQGWTLLAFLLLALGLSLGLLLDALG